MLKVLVAVDGSPSSNRAVDHVIKLKEAEGKMELHIINVQIPIESGHARMFVSGDDLEGYYREEGMAALKSARDKLDAAGVTYTSHILVGHVAERSRATLAITASTRSSWARTAKTRSRICC